MVCWLIDFALVVLKLVMFKVCVIIGISKIEFFNISGTERVKCEWYEYGEKSPKFFVNLEKKKNVQNRICKLIAEENQITYHKEISSNKIVLNKKLFKQNSSNNEVQNQKFPDSLNTKV